MFDDLHLTFGDLSQTRAAAERGLTDLLDAGTRIKVVATSGKVSLGFTRDRASIVAALNRLRSNPIPLADCPEIDYYTADRIINKNDSEALHEETRLAIEKCGGNPQFPELSMRMALKAARRSLEVHNSETRAALDSIRGVTLAMSVLPGERSMVFVSPGFNTPAGLPGMQEVIDRAARSGLVIQVLDARGLYSAAGLDTFDSEDNPGNSPNKLKYEQAGQMLNADVLRQLTDATGGTLFRNSNDYDAGFRQLSDRPGLRYVLGFSPPNDPAEREYHKLKVTVKSRKGLEVQARRGYLARRASSGPAKEAKEEIQNALLSRDEMRDIAMTVKSADLDATSGARKLNLLLTADAGQVQFQKEGGRSRDKLTLTFVFFDADGSMLSVLGQDVPLDLSESEFQSRLATGLNIRVNLEVKPGSRFLRVVLRDAEGQMSTLNQAIDQ